MNTTIVNPKAGRELLRKHGEFYSSKMAFDAISFALMLAKIGHSFAIARHKSNSLQEFEFLLPDLIKDGTTTFSRNVVGGFYPTTLPRNDALHEIRLFSAVTEKHKLLLVRLHLFAYWQTPIYHIVVGKSGLRG